MEKKTTVRAGGGRLGMSVSLLLLAMACREAPPGADDAPPERAETPEASVTVFFSRDEETVAVRRILEGRTDPRGPEEDPEGSRRSPEDVEAGLEAALKELLRGPTAEEREDGISSWFSAETAHALLSARVDGQGNAVVDFHDLASLIPAASASAGSAMLLAQLNATVFQHPPVLSVEYRVDGSCDAFWNWLQYDCQVLTREDAGFLLSRQTGPPPPPSSS